MHATSVSGAAQRSGPPRRAARQWQGEVVVSVFASRDPLPRLLVPCLRSNQCLRLWRRRAAPKRLRQRPLVPRIAAGPRHKGSATHSSDCRYGRAHCAIHLPFKRCDSDRVTGPAQARAARWRGQAIGRARRRR